MKCKLCKTDNIEFLKEIRILEKYDEKLYKCNQCDFVSYESVHWLEEAYQYTITVNDVGLTRRVLTNVAFITNFIEFLNLTTNVFDFGANNGLLAYFLTARGIRAKSYDRYENLIIGPVGNLSDLDDVGILCSFEVFEHLNDPAGDIDTLFSHSIPFIIISTELYDLKTNFNDWWYLQKDNGQHISFYSKDTMSFIADKYGYAYYQVYGRHVFSKYAISKKTLLKIEYAQKFRLRQLKEMF